MALHAIRKGLDLPLEGSPPSVVTEGAELQHVGIVADDYPGLKPRMHVEEGSTVLRGQLLFEDRKIEGALFTAPAAGRVVGIHRGARRALESVVIELDPAERSGTTTDAHYVAFESFTGKDPAQLDRDAIAALLSESGMWTALRTRPFSRTPALSSKPTALFVTAIDTEPLSPDPQPIVEAAKADFELGLRALAKLCEGKTYLCVAQGSSIANVDAPVQVEQFAGPHPAGLTGLHIHTLAPVTREKVAWSIGYQDVINVGRLFRTGKLDVERVIAIAGPALAEPRLVRTRVGACLSDLTKQDNLGEQVRVISGSALSGKAVTRATFDYIGRFVRQVTVIAEGHDRDFLGWLAPGVHRFSTIPTFISKWIGSKPRFTTSTNGSQRAIVPIGMYERVMPMDILATHLLRALSVGDIERAAALGCLELDEEDLALCTFVCPGKNDYGPVLRQNLAKLEAD